MARHPSPALPLAAGLVLFVACGTVQGQDLGKLLEQAGRQALRDVLSPLRPSAPSGPAQAVPGHSPPAAPVAGWNPFEVVTAPRPEVVPIKTADGWTLVAHHYPPTAARVAGAPPVILCHGLTYNAQFWDLDPSCSPASYLASRGFDVWAVDLRGCGLSQKWVWSLDDAPGAFLGSALRRATQGKLGSKGYQSLDPKYANWTMDDHIAHDVPALVYLVKLRTGHKQVAWVGHSMGGIVALAHLSRFKNPGIGRLVTVGSQLTMPQGRVAGQFFRELLTTREWQLAGTSPGAELIARSMTSVHGLFFNERNVAPAVYEALTTWAVDVPSVGLMKQYLQLSEKGVLLDASGRFNYAQALGNVKVPVLIAGGASDVFAPPAVQQFIHDRVGSTDKTLLIFGRASGYAADSGHNDALVGLNSQAQVYPNLARWLAAPH